MTIFLKKTLKFVLNHFTLAKLLGALFTAIVLASLKYYISGNLHIEYSDFWNNLYIALLGWVVNTSIIGWLSEYLGIKGLNLNLNQIFYGFDTMKIGSEYSLEEFKPKLYNAMNIDSGDESRNEGLDKGKDVDRGLDPNYDKNLDLRTEQPSGDNKLLDKSKDEVKTPLWTSPYVAPSTLDHILAKRTNPGPGFNVPGGEVPYNDAIVQHLDYNTHYLTQFKKMDLETAIEQKNNTSLLIRVLEGKLDYAKNTLSRIPTIPTTEYEFRLKNQILSDLDTLNRNKIRAEARATLLTSRIEFIEGKINKN